MKIKLTLFIVAFLFIQTLSIKAQDNLVTNGSFETVGSDDRPTVWEYSGSNVTWSTSSEVSEIPNGERVLNVDVTTTNSTKRSFGQRITGIVAGEKYKLSFYYNVYRMPSSSSGDLTYIVGWLDSPTAEMVMDDYTYRSDALYSIESTWMPIENEEDLTAPAGAVAASITFRVSHNIGVYLDDVRLVAANEVITGLSAAKAQSLFVRSENGNLIVSGAPAGSRIDVYNLFGERLQSVIAATGETVLSGLPKGQVLIVRNGNEAAKVLTK